MGDALQSRAPACQPGTRDSRSLARNDQARIMATFPHEIESSQRRFWLDCTMNIVGGGWRRETRVRVIFAEHRWASQRLGHGKIRADHLQPTMPISRTCRTLLAIADRASDREESGDFRFRLMPAAAALCCGQRAAARPERGSTRRIDHHAQRPSAKNRDDWWTTLLFTGRPSSWRPVRSV